MSTQKRILKTSLIVSLIAFLGYILALVKNIIIAYLFGAKGVTDAYLVATTLPELLVLPLGGAILNALIPVFIEYREKNEEDAWRMISPIINITLISSIVVVGVCFILSPWIISLIAPGLTSSLRSLSVHLFKILLPSVIFLMLGSILTGILNSYYCFNIPTIATSVPTLAIILSAILLTPRLGISSLAIGSLLGSVFVFLLQLIFIFKRKVGYYWLSVDFNHEGIKRITRMALAIILVIAISKINVIIDRIMASFLAEGSISVLNYGFTLVGMIHTVFLLSVATVSYPSMSKEALQKDVSAYQKIVRDAYKIIALIAIPASVGLMILSQPIISLLYQRGAFDVYASLESGKVLFFYSIGLFFMGLNTILARAFLSIKETMIFVKIGFLSFFSNIILNFVLMKLMGVTGLALSTSFAYIIIVGCWFMSLRGKGYFDFNREDFSYLAKIIAASFIMGAVVFLLKIIEIPLNRVVWLCLLILGGAWTYFMSLWILKVEEVNATLRIFSRCLKNYNI